VHQVEQLSVRAFVLPETVDLARHAAHPDGEADPAVHYEREPEIEAIVDCGGG
jgi:hypothetical protein